MKRTDLILLVFVGILFSACGNEFEKFLPKAATIPGPVITASSPANNAGSVDVSTTTLTLTFDSSVAWDGVKPFIEDIGTKDNGSEQRVTIPLTNSTVSVSGAVMSIVHNWGALPENTTLRITIPAGSLKNSAGGINTAQAIQFTTGIMAGGFPVVRTQSYERNCVTHTTGTTSGVWQLDLACSGSSFAKTSAQNPSGQDGLIYEAAFLAADATNGANTVTISSRPGVVFSSNTGYNSIQIGSQNYTITNVTGTTLTLGSNISGGTVASGSVVYRQQAGNPQTQRVRIQRITPAGYANDRVSLDAATGLTWTTCSLGQTFSTGGGAPCPGTPADFTWGAAIAGCSEMNLANSGAGYGGITTWRLPTAPELQSIIDYSRRGGAPDVLVEDRIDDESDSTSPFPRRIAITSGPKNFWSASGLRTQVTSSGVTRIVSNAASSAHFGTGIMEPRTKDSNAKVRCVSGPSAAYTARTWNTGLSTESDPNTLFQTGTAGAYNFSVVRDEATGLIWQKCAYGQRGTSCETDSAVTVNWIKAVQYCESLNSATGKFRSDTEWHLPSISELYSLTVRNSPTEAYDTNIFPNMPGGDNATFWSSTSNSPLLNSTNWQNARLYNLKFGFMLNAERCASSATPGSPCAPDTGSYYVRCVKARTYP